MRELDSYKYIIEARTKNLLKGVIVLGDTIEEVTKGYFEWVTGNNLKQKKMLFADLFENMPDGEPKNISFIKILAADKLMFEPAQGKNLRRFFHPKKGIIPLIQQILSSYISTHFGEYTLIKGDERN